MNELITQYRLKIAALHDYYTIELMALVGIELSDQYTSIELLFAMETMRDKGYTLRLVDKMYSPTKSSQTLGLYFLGTLVEGYEIFTELKFNYGTQSLNTYVLPAEQERLNEIK